MVEKLIEKANTLIEALPYMRNFFGRTFVIKYGGNAMTSPELKESVILDLILLKFIGINPVVVHGGGPAITAMLKKVGKETRFEGGLRVTDAETVEIAQMVLVGKINKEIVSLINRHGGRAVGLSGIDAGLIKARAAEGGRLGFVGEICGVDPGPLHLLGQEGYIPVIATIGVGEAGESYNINADLVAGELAAALHADKLIMLTDVEGLLDDPKDKASLISTLTVAEGRELLSGGLIEGGMIPKLTACMRAAEAGVRRTHIIDGRVKHSMLLEIFTDHGIGTMVLGEGVD